MKKGHNKLRRVELAIFTGVFLVVLGFLLVWGITFVISIVKAVVEAIIV